MKTTIVLSTILLSACVAPPMQQLMYKEGASLDQTQRDTLYCKQFAMQSVSSRGMGTNLFAPIAIDNETRECLQFLGYR